MVRALPAREKDKLLLRLIAKDDLLLEQLTYRHLEREATLDQRAGELRDYYRRLCGPLEGMSPGILMMSFRQGSGYITRHVRVTRDKLGEVQLLVDMLHYGLDANLRAMRRQYRNPRRWIKLAQYLCKRLPTTMRKADKLHPDLYLEFEGQLNDLLQLIWDTPELSGEAERTGLARRWEPPGV